MIQGPVSVTRDNNGNIRIQPSNRPVGRALASEKASSQPSSIPERKNLRGKLPRPPNSFILYRQQHHPMVKKAHPKLHNNEICKSCNPQTSFVHSLVISLLIHRSSLMFS